MHHCISLSLCTKMAEILATLLSKVVVLLAEGAQPHISAVGSVGDELRKLESELTDIQPFLEDAHDKQFTSGHIKHWISSVHDIICDAEDIIDLYKAKTRDLDAQTRQGKVRRQLSSLSFMCRNFLFMHKTASEIKEVTERLHKVYEQKTNLGLVPLTTRSGPPQDQIEFLSRNRLTTSNITEQKTFGREKDEELVVEWLKKSLNNETEQNIDVVAIVGMGGLGKTTLAKKVYHNSSIRGHFEKHMWICASERPQLLELFKQILEVVGGKGSGANEIIGLDALNLEIAKHLKQKRFLLVIDDVWDCRWWDELNGLLKEGVQGSRVLITTRKEEVAKKMDATNLHRLNCLSSDESWCLFVNKVLRRDETEEELDRVKDVGLVVVEKCKGLPLALSVVGSMLKHKERRRSDWQEVANSPIWEWKGILDNGENKEILSTIALSYMNLPFPLKRCLTYCSMYPKDHLMYKEDLAWLWVAEGFIPEDEALETESCARKYLDDLIGCSLIQHSVREGYYMLHDIIHDFASYMRGNENEKPYSSTGNHSSQTRALCLTKADGSTINGINQHTRLRTLVLTWYVREMRLPADIFLKLKWLRVIDLSRNPYLVELPDCLGDLVLLKYLNLFKTLIEALPESISRLTSLEMLNIKETNIRILPQHTSKLSALRRLYLNDPLILECMPRMIGRLTRLQTLSHFVVGSRTRESSGCSIRELHDMNKLEGSLCIDHIERIQIREEAKDAKLHKKANLRELRLRCWLCNRPDEKMEGIFEELQPPTGLKTLEISYYAGTRFPAWIGSLRCLERLFINNCNFLKELPMLAHLRNLEALEIFGMEVLEEWSFDTHEEPMPCLRSLRITNCPKLRALPVGFALLESLESSNMESLEEWPLTKPMRRLLRLEIDNCPKLRVIPIGFPKLRLLRINRMTSLEEWNQIETLCCLQSLEIRDCPKLRVIPDGLRFTELYELKLRDLPELGLTPLASLENFRGLELGGLPKFDSQEHGFLQVLKTATTLRHLDLEGFSNLATESRMVEEAIGNMNQLEHLSMRNCPNLAVSVATVLQHHHLPKLRSVRIFSGNSVVGYDIATKLTLELEIEAVDAVSGFGNLGSRIDGLGIRLMGELDSIPEWVRRFQNLKQLVIVDSPKLTRLPEWLGEFSQLGTLKLNRLNELTHLPEWLGKLTRLAHLELDGLPLLGSLPDQMQHLRQLQILEIKKCPNLRTLPEWLGNLSQLFSLYLEGLPLTSLPDGLGQLSMLRYLDLRSLNGLRGLPEGVGGLPNLREVTLEDMREMRRLPDGMRGNLSIKLNIINCPHLVEHSS